MSILDNAKEWALNNVIDDDTLAVLLVGSWARGQGTDVNDIDVIVIKQYQLFAIMDQEHKQEGYTLDVWIHDIDAIKSELEDPASDLNQVNNISMILSFLDSCVVWFEREPIIDDLKTRVSSWSWDPDYHKFLEFNSVEPEADYLKNAYNESLAILEASKKRLDGGKEVSHRRKDYPELVKESSEELAQKVLGLTLTAYEKMGIERHWTEFGDAKKAVSMGNWGNALASLKDVLRFMIRYDLPSVPEQLLDPSIWKTVEDMHISPELAEALKAAFSE